MDEKRFDDYQMRMLNAMKKPSIQSNDSFTKLSIILDNLKKFLSNESFSQTNFRKEVLKQFASVDSSDNTAKHFQNRLYTFCSSKKEAMKTISDLYSMVKPLSQQINSWSSIAKLANECMKEIQESIYNSN